MIKILNFFDFKLGRIFFGNDNNFIINLYGSYKNNYLKQTLHHNYQNQNNLYSNTRREFPIFLTKSLV